MRKLAAALLIIAAFAVFGAAGYTLVHKDRVAQAGDLLPQPTTSSRATPTPSTSTTRPAGPPPVVAFIGDDWASGKGASATGKRFSTLLCAALGLHEVNAAVPGSGYAKQAASGESYASQVAAVVSAKPDVVIVSGGRNDVGADPTFVSTQALRLVEKLHSRLSQAVLIVIAPMWGDSAAPSALKALGTALQRDAASVGATYLAIADPIFGHPTYMADSADPDDAGQAAIAAALKPRLAPLIPRG